MLIAALIAGVVLLQKAKYCMKYIFMILTVRHIFQVSEHDVMTTLP